MKLLSHMLLIMLLAGITLPVQAQQYEKLGVDTTAGIPTGLAVGSKAPDFSGTDQWGKSVKLNEVLDNQRAVVFFYRGYWCGLCNEYLKAYQDSLEMIEGQQARVIGIAAEKPAHIKKMTGKVGAAFSLIYDEDMSIMQAYGVGFQVTEDYQDLIVEYAGVDIKTSNNQNKAVLPVPATYIIEQDGTISYKQFDVNYKYRATAKDIIEHLQ